MALRSELRMLKIIVEKEMDFKCVMKETSDEFFNEVIEKVSMEVLRIEDALRETMMNIDNELQKQEYFLQHQVHLVRMMDKVYDSLLPNNPATIYEKGMLLSAARMYKQVFICLENLLLLLQRDFATYFNGRVKVPEAWRCSLELMVNERLEGIKEKLAQGGVEKRLIEVACMPLTGILLIDLEISNGCYSFLKLLLNEIEHFETTDETTIGTERFLQLLWRINYNSVWIVNYCIIEYDLHIKEAATLDEAMQYLLDEKRKLRLITTEAEIAYRQEQEPLSVFLINWIKQELVLLRKQQLFTKQKKAWGKIVTTLSVEDLGYGCRLLHREGLFPEIDETDLLTIAASCFITPKSRDISIESIKNKSSNPGAGAKQRIKGHLYDMARKIQ